MRSIKKNLPAIIIIMMIMFSIVITYYKMVVLSDYDIIFNEDGLPVLDE